MHDDDRNGHIWRGRERVATFPQYCCAQFHACYNRRRNCFSPSVIMNSLYTLGVRQTSSIQADLERLRSGDASASLLGQPHPALRVSCYPPNMNGTRTDHRVALWDEQDD
jgi:hypothetical protein